LALDAMAASGKVSSYLEMLEEFKRPEKAAHAHVLRDLFNPFRPLLLNPSLLTPTILSLAQAAYDELLLPQGHFDPQRLSVLADALEEVGAGEDLIAHLRSPGPHVRGCHVVDAVLSRG